MTSLGSHTAWDPWTYGRDVDVSAGQRNLVGLDVEATDGSIGKVDEATYDVGVSSVVVDTGLWIFGTKVMLPAGTISRVDRDGRKIYVARSKDEIKSAPKFDKDAYRDRAYRDSLADYYRKFRV